MVRFLADEDFNRGILIVLRNLAEAYELECEVIRVQDTGLMGAGDSSILDWAAANDRVVLTHDRRTMPPSAWDRIAAGRPMCGVIVVVQGLSISRAGHLLATEINVRAHEKRGWEDEVLFL